MNARTDSTWTASTYKDIPAGVRYRTCDRCPELATRVVHTKRPNTGLLISYWCDEHKPQQVNP